jgi:cytochrome c553
MRIAKGFMTLIGLFYAALAVATAAGAPAKPDLERGKQIAGAACAACHGADGNSLIPANPILAGQRVGDVVADYIAHTLAEYKSDKPGATRKNPIMKGMAAALSPEDMRDVGAWFAAQKITPSVARDKSAAVLGEKIWRGGIKHASVPACAGCHGPAGKGIPAQYPRVAGQYADYTLAALKAYAAGVERTNPMMTGVAAKLSEADMKAVSEYMAGLR